MKKTTKRILAGIGVLTGVIIILSVIYFIVFSSTLKKMTPVKTGKIMEDVYAIRDSYVNMFLVTCDSGYIAIDAGNDAEVIKEELLRMGISSEEVKAVLLTHSDADHVAAVTLFPEAPVYLSELEEQMITGKTPRFLFFKNKLNNERIQFLKDNQVVNISGCMIKCISTPGHTKGSMSYLVNGQYLFTGDCLRLENGKAREFYHFINMDTKTEKNSINRIAGLSNISVLFTGHHGITNEVEAAFANWQKE